MLRCFMPDDSSKDASGYRFAPASALCWQCTAGTHACRQYKCTTGVGASKGVHQQERLQQANWGEHDARMTCCTLKKRTGVLSSSCKGRACTK